MSINNCMDIKKLAIQIEKLTCNRCGHKWIPRVIPVTCPKCKSYYWNEDKDFDRRKKEFKEEKFKPIQENKIN